MAAVLADFIQGGTRKRIAQGFLRRRADSVVIGVKKIAELGIEGTIAGQMRCKNERLKKPAGMSLVPFRRAGVGAGLHHLVFRAQRGSQGLRLLAAGVVTLGQRRCCALSRRAKGQNGFQVDHESFTGTTFAAGLEPGQPYYSAWAKIALCTNLRRRSML